MESGSLGASRAMQLGFDSKDSGESTLGLPVRLLRFAFGPLCPLILLLAIVNDTCFSVSQRNARISGILEPSILCCHCPSPISPLPRLRVGTPHCSQQKGTARTGGPDQKKNPPKMEGNMNLPGVGQCHFLQPNLKTEE